MSYEILGVDLYHIFSWFVVYSFLGWVWESSYVSIRTKAWVNRGFVSGPFVTIYGVGAVSVYVILRPLAGQVIELYFAGVFVATLLEYVTGVLMETIFHTNWWDYSGKKFNFQGKICLGSSIAWGFFTLILFYVLQPIVSDLVELVPRSSGILFLELWSVYYVVDFSFSAAAAFDLRGKMQKLDVVWEDFQDYLKTSRLHELAEELHGKAELYRLEASAGKVSEYLEQRRALFHQALEERLEDLDKRNLHMERYDEFARRYLEIKNSFRRISVRHMRAYPNLISKADRIRKLRNKKEKAKKEG